MQIQNQESIDDPSVQAQSREELLAAHIAIALDDRDNYSIYRRLASKYPEELLRKVLAEVRKVPQEKIRKSRGALFTYLVKRYAGKTSENSWN